jgi:hypothetical protein
MIVTKTILNDIIIHTKYLLYFSSTEYKNTIEYKADGNKSLVKIIQNKNTNEISLYFNNSVVLSINAFNIIIKNNINKSFEVLVIKCLQYLVNLMYFPTSIEELWKFVKISPRQANRISNVPISKDAKDFLLDLKEYVVRKKIENRLNKKNFIIQWYYKKQLQYNKSVLKTLNIKLSLILDKHRSTFMSDMVKLIEITRVLKNATFFG